MSRWKLSSKNGAWLCSINPNRLSMLLPFFLIKSILQQYQHLLLIFYSFFKIFLANIFLASLQVSFKKSIATYDRNFLYYEDASFFFMDITHIEKGGVFFVTVFRYFFNECNFLYYKDALFSLLAIFYFFCWA